MQALCTHRNRAVLVIAEPVAGQRRAHELRMRGYPTWVVSRHADLRWLVEQARISAAFAVIDVSLSRSSDRASWLADMVALAGAAGLPCLLVGAEDHEQPLFPNVTGSLPPHAAVDWIVDALR